MIRELKEMKIDYVKFQSLSDEKIARHPELNYYKKASINENNIMDIDEVCLHNKMNWFCTPYFSDAVKFLDQYIPFFKIPYSERNNDDLINKCLETGKSVYLAVDRPRNKIPNTKQIYCIPNYPTRFGEINFDMIKLMDGYSNHCLDPLAILKAKRYGAKYIEFHVSADLGKFSVDNKVSFDLAQTKEMMRWLK